MWRQVKRERETKCYRVWLEKRYCKKYEETKQACISLKTLFCLYLSPIGKLWPRKKVILKVLVFWSYSKTLIISKLAIIKESKISTSWLKKSQEANWKANLFVPPCLRTFFVSDLNQLLHYDNHLTQWSSPGA